MTKTPPLAVTSRLVARALDLSAMGLHAALSPATLNELPAVLDFRRQHLGTRIGWDDARYLPWRYHLGRSDIGFGDLWMLRRHGDLLALIGSESMVCTDGLHTQRGQRLMDILVRPDLADTGLGAWLNQALFEHTDFTIAVGANRFSKGLVTRLFAPLAPMHTSVHPLHWQPFLERSRAPASLKHMVARSGGLLMSGWAAALRWHPGHGLALRPIKHFEEGPDALPPCALHQPGTVQFVRTGSYLNRRLLGNPRVHIEALGTYRGGQRTAYIAWHQCERPDRAPELRIIDWHVGADRPLLSWGVLLRAAIATARQRGCSSVRLSTQNSALPPLRRSHGFFEPRGSPTAIVGLHGHAHATAWDAKLWALTSLCDDGDEH
jgi:GNAT superfamily N-acetyltransferase